jgi:hypothetical protein
MEVWDPDASDPGGDLGEGFGGSVNELAWAIDAHEQLGFDDLIVQLEPKTIRSLDRLAEHSNCGPTDPSGHERRRRTVMTEPANCNNTTSKGETVESLAGPPPP